MPRNARKNIYSNFFHIMIQGINKEYIFQKEKEIKTYLKFLTEKSKDKNLQIIAYCIMNNHAHFLIYTEEINEISKLMSQVNTQYAIYYNKLNNRSGYVFRNRYKAEEILTQTHLISCINYIHNNPVKAKMCNKKSEYKYSSYNEYKKEGNLLNINAISEILEKNSINIKDLIGETYENELYKFIEYKESVDKEKTKRTILKKFCNENNIKDVKDITKDKKHLKEISTIMYIEYNFTQKEIAEMLGVNRLKIHRILNEL